MKQRNFEDVLDFMFNNYQKCPYDFPFDMDSPPDKFGYFECIMAKDGKVYEAPNGHQRGAVLMLARDLGITAEEVEQRALANGADYLEWIVAEAQVLLIWNRFFIGNPNKEQLESINSLKDKGHMHHTATNRGAYYGR